MNCTTALDLSLVLGSSLRAREGNGIIIERHLRELTRSEDGISEVNLFEIRLADFATEIYFLRRDLYLRDGVHVGRLRFFVSFLLTARGQTEREACEEEGRSPFLGIHINV